MRVARLHGPGDVRLHDEPRPTPGAGEVLVRVEAVGLCGSDLHWFDEGSIGGIPLTRPLSPGHELAGTTEDGRRVAVDPAIPCETCPPCREGHPNLCPSVRFAGYGEDDGALREWMAWPERCLYPLPDSLSATDGAMLEPLGVALHAVDLAHLRPGSDPEDVAGVARRRKYGIQAHDLAYRRADVETRVRAEQAILLPELEDPLHLVRLREAVDHAVEVEEQ